MMISGLQNTSPLYSKDLTNVSTAPSASAPTDSSLDGGSYKSSPLANLISSIQSGDMAGAKQYLNEAEEYQSSAQNSPLSAFLGSVSEALSKDDLGSAQKAVSTLEVAAPHGISYSSLSLSTSALPGTVAGSAQNAPQDYDSIMSSLQADVLNLFGAVASGDTSGAHSAYNTLTKDMNISSIDSVTNTTNDATSGNPLATAIQKIGKSLQTNDINSAQATLTNFLDNLSSGSVVNTTV
ncbi:hypothetical protein ACOBR2_10355 [Telmatobacter bradus]|uniref:hypothetical protein n=1 Tax=Telmatobacter bradus TaxID=474953 RepID=UPI003B42902D